MLMKKKITYTKFSNKLTIHEIEIKSFEDTEFTQRKICPKDKCYIIPLMGNICIGGIDANVLLLFIERLLLFIERLQAIPSKSSLNSIYKNV